MLKLPHAVVTGASSGIGRASAVAVAERGQELACRLARGAIGGWRSGSGRRRMPVRVERSRRTLSL